MVSRFIALFISFFAAVDSLNRSSATRYSSNVEIRACNVVNISVLSAPFAQSGASTPNDLIMKPVTHIAKNTLCSRLMRDARLAACVHDGYGRFRRPVNHLKHD